jgi:ubiquinone/menaquinone biosynthesis C-methylase UbiE
MTPNTVIEEAFTEIASHYEETMDRELGSFLGLSYSEFADGLVELVSPEEGDVVLDVATGTAYFPRRLADEMRDKCWIVGLDITPAMLDYGLKKVKGMTGPARISLVCASGMAMPFGEGVFDIIVCGMGTHHMDVPVMLSSMRRVLEAGGRLIMVDVGASTFWRSFWGAAFLRIALVCYGVAQKSARAQAEIEAFSNIRTADEWCNLLADAGFSKSEVSETRARRFWYPHVLTMTAVAGES